MTRPFPPPVPGTTAASVILIEAARRWRRARDAGEPIQPCLARALAAHGCVMLAPVLDSLIRFYESALGRRIEVGRAMRLSGDERLLLGLVDGSAPRACIGCPERAAIALDCALCSTRIMLAMALDAPGASGVISSPAPARTYRSPPPAGSSR